MKNFIKKSAVTTLSMIGILSAMPSAFCSSNGENSMTQSASEEEYYPVLCEDGVRNDGSAYFSEGSFSSSEFKEVLRGLGVINSEGKCNDGWRRIVQINHGEYKGKDPRNGCRVIFKSNEGKLVIFEFGLCDDRFSTAEYNELLIECGVEEALI